MSASLKKMLRYYQQELVMNDALRSDFARRHPMLAGALGADAAGGDEQDPHIRRLLQAIALMNAHTAMRIDASQQWLSEALLQINYPHFLRPFPSCTIVQFDGGASGHATSAGSAVTTIPRGTMLYGPMQDGVRCCFQTVYPVEISPVRMLQARFAPVDRRPATFRLPSDVRHILSLGFEASGGAVGIAETELQQIRLFIDAAAAMSAHLRDALFMHAQHAWIECGDGGVWNSLETVPLGQVGFGEEDAILPFPARSPHAYRLLMEYGCFPEKFNFLTLDLAAAKRLIPPRCRRFTLHLGVVGMGHGSDVAQVLGALSEDHLRQSCTPAVNLFPKAGSPVAYDHTQTEYGLPTDAIHPQAFDIFSVDRVCAIEATSNGKADSVEYHPVYSLKHGSKGGRKANYYYVRRKELLADLSPGHAHTIALVDMDFNPLQVRTATMSTELTCTNGDLPCRMPFGAPYGDLSMAESPGAMQIRILRKPSRSQRFSLQDGWRLVSHLALNHHSLLQEDAEPLKEMLMLYNLSQSSVYERQLAGIVGLSATPARIRWRDRFGAGFVKGIEIRLVLDTQAYAGSGMHIFIALLDHFVGLLVHLNSYVQLSVHCHQSGREVFRCAPRNGNLFLI